ncbi:MAG: nitroreductase family protein [Thermoflexales bacterium]|nr:nitroreductase family protein [Thermoflexales bacterium]
MTAFGQLLVARRMTRRFKPDALPPGALERILDAATRAPSPHNRQPWRFAIVSGPARVRLGQAMGDRLIADLIADGVAAETALADAARSRERIATAPAAVLVCITMADLDLYPDPRRAAAERWMAGQAAAAAAENMILQASELGIGACWMCAPLFCPEAVRTALDLPADWEPQALIPFGFPAAPGRDRPRRPAAELSVIRDA